jgi:hypothetical protein
MRFAMHGFIKAAGALALTGGVLVVSALPAAAAAPNRAYAASAFGVVSHRPIGEATFPGISPVHVRHARIDGILTTDFARATAGPTTASSFVATPVATLGKLVALGATSVRSSCRFNTNTGRVRGTSFILNGKVNGLGVPFSLPAHPHPNTHIGVPGIASLTLNRQTTARDGTLTVQAIHIALLGRTQILNIGVSVCNDADLAPVPILPGPAAPAALGGLGLLLLAGAGYHLSRRRRLAAA